MNKKLKRALIIIVVLAAAIALAVLQPYKYVFDLPLLNQNAGLTINSVSGKADVYLDGEKIGETPYSSENLKAGDYELELKRQTQQENFYEPVSKNIKLESNTRTFVEAEIGPTARFSSTKIIYYREENSADASFYISTEPSDAKITIDEIKYGNSPVTETGLSAKTQILKVEKPGYETAEVEIILRNGYTLIANINLMAKPVEIQEYEQ